MSADDIRNYRMIDPFASRNVLDKYKTLTNEEIKADIKANSLPIAALAMNLVGDFNMSCCIRSANALGVREFYYFGERKFDRRGCLGSYHYSAPQHIKSFAELIELKEKWSFVALEQNSKSVDIRKFNWQTRKPPVIVLGEEGCGLSKEMVELCDYCVEIPQLGSIRSINVAAAFSIAVYDFVNKYDANINNSR